MQTSRPRPWYVYLLRCRDHSLYCGISNDLSRRIGQHNAGTGAKYVVPSRRPAVCVWKRRMGDRSQALSLEYWVKQLSTEAKGNLAGGRNAVRRGSSGEWKLVRGAAARGGGTGPLPPRV